MVTNSAEIGSTIIRIKKKLHRIQWTPRFHYPFGASNHLYQMKPTLSPSQVSSFEDTHGIKLPEGYREFLLNIGNGGAGPYYGILPLEKWGAALWDEIENPEDKNLEIGLLASSSPLIPDIEYGNRWEDSFDKPGVGVYQGAITICHQGCSFYALLIVTGEACGRVINIDEEKEAPPQFAPYLDFLSWYEGWIDLTLDRVDFGWYGYPDR